MITTRMALAKRLMQPGRTAAKPDKRSQSVRDCQEIRKGEKTMTTVQATNIHSKVRRFAAGIRYSMLALAILGAGASCVLAQEEHSHMPPEQNGMTRQQQTQANALVKIVRESTERFKNVSVA